jgi:hypothetical protein
MGHDGLPRWLEMCVNPPYLCQPFSHQSTDLILAACDVEANFIVVKVRTILYQVRSIH